MASSDDAPCRPCSCRSPKAPCAGRRARWLSCVPAMAGHCAKWPATARCTANRASPRSRNRCSRLPWTVSGQLDDAAGRGRYPLVLVLPPRQRRSPCAVRPCAGAGRRWRPHRCLPVQQRRCAFGRGRPQAVGRPRWLPDQNHCRVYWTARCRAGTTLTWPSAGRRWMRCARSWAVASSAARACSPGIASIRRRRCWPSTCRPTWPDAPPTSARATAICRANFWNAARRSPRWTCTRPSSARWHWPSSIWRRRRDRCRCVSCGRTSPPASSRATTSSSATRRSTRLRALTARTSASASSPWLRRRCARAGACTWWPTATCLTSTPSTTASARCAWSPSATVSSWWKP